MVEVDNSQSEHGIAGPLYHNQDVEQVSYASHPLQSGHQSPIEPQTEATTGLPSGPPHNPTLQETVNYIVEFDGPADPEHPQNWPMKKKFIIGIVLTYTTLISAFTSSIFSVAIGAIGTEFDVSQEVGLLGIALYVLGFATGPTLWAPLSELIGRRLPLIISTFGFALFQIATATGKDLQTILLGRFWGGFFGACPLAVVPAVFADIFNHRTRGLAITIFSVTVFCSPLLGPLIGGLIVESYLGWRWTEYLVAIMGFLAFALNILFLHETYTPTILTGRARETRLRTSNWAFHAEAEEQTVSFNDIITKNLTRPLRMLITDPIITLTSLYMAFLYGLLYLALTAYPVVFQGVHGFSLSFGGIPYLAMIVGMLFAGIYIILSQPAYARKLKNNNNFPIPEWRLPQIIVGAVSFTIGLFWFGWTGYRADIHWLVPTFSGLLTGFGILTMFLQSTNYIIDTYLMFAASAIAANTIARSITGAAFVLFSPYMYRDLGIQWSFTLLGCIGAVFVPIPIAFIIYGKQLRAMSRFASIPPPLSKTAPVENEMK